MKSHTHSPDTAAAAHRHELHDEPQTRNERPVRAGGTEMFRDLRRRNERRARLAAARIGRQFETQRVVPAHRERGFPQNG